MKNNLHGISLFCGAGGMDCGFTNAGFEILLANDLNRDACASYSENHDHPIVVGDALKILPLLERTSDVDVIFGGPPCQGFSVAGKMDPKDKRSTLMNTFFDAVISVKPKTFVCENVKAFATLRKWQPMRETILKRIRKYYSATIVVLNSSDFGVPQSRERMFIIGVRKDLCNMGEEPFTNLVQSTLETLKSPAPTIQQIIKRLGKAGTKNNRTVCNAKITYAKSPIMRKSPYAGMLFNGAGRPLSAKGYASTLPASMGGNKTPIVDEKEIFEEAKSFVEVYHHELMAGKTARKGNAPSRLRRLTVEECLAIQTFPETYILKGSKSSKYKQIGNAVPCKLAEAVAQTTERLIHLSEMGVLKDNVLQAAE